MKCMLVDEAHYRGNQASTDFNNGLITQDRLPAWGSVSYLYTWNDMYKSIRYCNMFLKTWITYLSRKISWMEKT